jgi:hypothetical protein
MYTMLLWFLALAQNFQCIQVLLVPWDTVFENGKKMFKNWIQNRNGLHIIWILLYLVAVNWNYLNYTLTKVTFLELVSKELNHLAVILHVYAGDLIFMK